MRTTKWLAQLLLMTLALCIIPIVSAQAFAPERPAPSTVLDSSGYIEHETIEVIDEKNRQWSETDEQLQIGVYVINHLPTDIESLANETFRKWQVGFSGTDNGILLLISIEDREFRIETSDNASTVLTDVKAKQILNNSRDYFRNQKYDDGILYILSAIEYQFYNTEPLLPTTPDAAPYSQPDLENAEVRRYLENYSKQHSQTSSSLNRLDFDDKTIILTIMFALLGILTTFFRGDVGDSSDASRSGSSGSNWSSTSSSSSSKSFSSSSSKSFSSSSSRSSSSSGSSNWSGGKAGGGGASSKW